MVLFEKVKPKKRKLVLSGVLPWLRTADYHKKESLEFSKVKDFFHIDCFQSLI